MALNTKDRKRLATLLGNISFLHYFHILKGIALSRFEWEGFPETVDLDYLNETLLSKDCSFFKDNDLGDDGYLVLESSPIGGCNVYGKFEDRTVLGQNGYTNKVNAKNSVLIKCNLMVNKSRFMTPLEGIEYYAMELAEVDRTMMINIKKQKMPWVLEADPKLQLTIDNLISDAENGVPVVRVDQNFSEYVKVLNTVAPFVATQLFDLKKSIWQEALAFLGVSNTAIEKRERVNSAEIEANDSGTVAQRYITLVPLVRACEKINRMFPELHVSVKFRDNLTASLDGISDKVDESEVDTDDTERLSD